MTPQRRYLPLVDFSYTEQELALRGLSETGADLERMLQTLDWALEGKRPSDEDLLEVRAYFAHLGSMTLARANDLHRGGGHGFRYPPYQAPKQRPGVPARLATFVEKHARKLRSRPSPLAE